MNRIYTLLFAAFCLSGCEYNDRSRWDPHFDGTAYRPVYMSEEEISNITFRTGEPLVEPGKIYLLEPFLFINEKGRGVHIIDNSDPSNPENISFISIPGNYDMAAKGNWLYADNYTDLLTFDISNPREVRLTNRIADAVPVRDFPPHNNIYFECPDPSKGTIVAWEKVDVSAKPKCWR